MIPFTKAHANGNDFLILDEADAHGNHAQLARHLCARSTGIGADGIEFLNRSEARSDPANLTLRLFNADGSEAELSGNGTRCVAAVLALTEHLSEATFRTAAGPRRCRVLTANAPHFTIETSMGIPRVAPLTLDLPDMAPITGLTIDLGNPHFVLFPDNVDFSLGNLPWQDLGALLTNHPAFPHGTNIEFVRPISSSQNPTEIAFRIFERGCGPTTSSGTGTCAAATAAIHALGASRDLTVVAEGGSQHVLWAAPDADLLLTGPAEILCSGQAFRP